MKFKVGDRVAVYSFNSRLIGTIIELAQNGVLLNVEQKHGSCYWFHSKQCRRLIKKKPKEIWMRASGKYTAEEDWYGYFSGTPKEGYTKFREVK